MLRVVSVSLGSSTRNSAAETEFLGQKIRMERIGTDGDWDRLLQTMRDLDGNVDAIGVGGIKLHVHTAGRAYTLRGSDRVAAAVKQTPLVDGSGLKDTIERRTFHIMEQNNIPIKSTPTLLMSAIDRFGMAETLDELGADVVYGDFMFGLNLPLPIRNLKTVWLYGRAIGPILKFIPFEWLYPVGKEQEKITPRYGSYYDWAKIVCGDFHYIRRYMPERLDGKIIVTNTVTSADVELLRERNARMLVTGSPEIGGRSYATNALEAVLVALSGKGRALTRDEYNKILDEMNYMPRMEDLSVSKEAAVTGQ